MDHVSNVEHHEHSGGGTKEIIKVTIILSVLTVVELALGFWMISMENGGFWKNLTKGVIIILMLAKAFYIVGYFMHLKHEIRNLIMTICIPLFLFVWFIIAFLYDGKSYNNNRSTYDPYYKVQSNKPMPVTHEGKDDKMPSEGEEEHEKKSME